MHLSKVQGHIYPQTLQPSLFHPCLSSNAVFTQSHIVESLSLSLSLQPSPPVSPSPNVASCTPRFNPTLSSLSHGAPGNGSSSLRGPQAQPGWPCIQSQGSCKLGKLYDRARGGHGKLELDLVQIGSRPYLRR